MKHRNRLIIGLGLAMATSSGMSAAAPRETKGPVTDDIGVVVIPKGAPIQIGAYWVMSGADSALGIDEKRGVEIAIKDQGGNAARPPDQIEHRGRRVQRRRRSDRRDEAGRESQHRDRAGTRLLQRRDAGRANSLESRNHRHRYGDHGAEADRGGSQARI